MTHHNSHTMKGKQLELLEEYLWKLTKVIGETPGLPEDWMQRRVEDLANIFRPEPTTSTLKTAEKVDEIIDFINTNLKEFHSSQEIPQEESGYMLLGNRAYWVTTLNGEVIYAENYTHQDDSFNHFCNSNWCRCQQ